MHPPRVPPILARYPEDGTLAAIRTLSSTTGVVLLAALIYAGVWAVLPHDGLFINDNGCKLIQTAGIVRNGGADLSVPWPGRGIDPGLSFRPLGDPFGSVVRGRLFVSFSIPFALATALPFRLFGTGGLTLLPLVAGLVLLPAMAALASLLGAGPRGTWCAVLGTAFGTPLWFYAYTLWEHLPSTCLVTWGLVLLLRSSARRDGGRAIAGAAMLCGLGVWMRDDVVLFALAMAAIPLVVRSGESGGSGGRWRAPALYLAVLAITLVPLGIGQWLVVGTPLGLHATTHGPFEHGLERYVVDRWTVFRDLVLDSHGTAWVSLVAGIPYVLLLLLHPALERRRMTRAGALLSLWAIGWGGVALAGHLTSPAPMWYLPSANGLFAVSPFLVLACLRERGVAGVPGSPGTMPDRVRTAIWCVVLFDLGLYVLAAPTLHVAGIHWGSRLLMPLFPALGALAGATAGRMIGDGEDAARPGAAPSGALRALAAVLVVAALGLSAAFQVHGLRLLDAQERFGLRLNAEVMRREVDAVVATTWVVPQTLAPSFYDRPIYLVRNPVDLQRLAPMLAGAGATRVLVIDAAPSVAGTVATDEIVPDDSGFMTYRLTGIDLR